MATVGELCIREVIIGHRHERLAELARRMRDYHVGSVIIVDDEPAGRVPVAIVTDRDLVMAFVEHEPERIAQLTVRDLVPGRILTANEGEDFYEVLVRMRGYGVRRFPIVNGQGVLVGIVSFDDLVTFAAEQMSRLAALVDRERRREREHVSGLRPPSSGGADAPSGHLRWR